MPPTGTRKALGAVWAMFALCVVCTGCMTGREYVDTVSEQASVRTAYQGMPATALGRQTTGEAMVPIADGGPAVAGSTGSLPRELEKVTHPTYVIQPPDILLVDATRLIPRPPYRADALDSLAIYVDNTLADKAISGIYTIDPGGFLNLGFNYGSVNVLGKTIEETKQAIDDQLKKKLKPPYSVHVALADSRVMQQVRGEHLVRQDGTIGLGTYGGVYVTGLTIAQAKAAIEAHLSKFLFEPKVSVDVGGFNSQVYFVIFDYPGTGQTVFRLPITGNETVLDAVSELRGLPAGVSKRRIWVARPAPAKCGRTQILPVDWAGITRNGETATNYQLLPGDRVYVTYDQLAAIDITLARVFGPIERVFGISLLGDSVINTLRLPGGGLGGSSGVR
jgi:polysaccharide biosynthesis/export protein